MTLFSKCLDSFYFLWNRILSQRRKLSKLNCIKNNVWWTKSSWYFLLFFKYHGFFDVVICYVKVHRKINEVQIEGGRGAKYVAIIQKQIEKFLIFRWRLRCRRACAGNIYWHWFLGSNESRLLLLRLLRLLILRRWLINVLQIYKIIWNQLTMQQVGMKMRRPHVTSQC